MALHCDPCDNRANSLAAEKRRDGPEPVAQIPGSFSKIPRFQRRKRSHAFATCTFLIRFVVLLVMFHVSANSMVMRPVRNN
jgi:hypothetical protein